MPSLLHGQAEVGGHRWTGRAFPAPLRPAQGRQEELNSTLDPQRRAALLESGLRALVRARWGEEVAEGTTAHRLAFGAALTGHDDAGISCAWGLAAGGVALGAFLAWASQHGESHLHLCVDVDNDEAATLARQATAFTLPVTVWRVDGSSLSAVDPQPLAPPAAVAAEVLAAFVPLIEEAGADPVVEEGLLRAEVLGLEVARVVTDPDAGAVLQIGVGRHDRAARIMLGQTDQGLLSSVVAVVRAARTPDAPANPANQLAPERWLRAVIVAHPELVGAATLTPVPAPVARPDLRRRAPAPAVGTDRQGAPVVVVCSVGVDPDLVTSAADARLAAAVGAGSDAGHLGLILAVPEGDDHPLTRHLAAVLRHPAGVVTIGAGWRHQ